MRTIVIDHKLLYRFILRSTGQRETKYKEKRAHRCIGGAKTKYIKRHHKFL